MSYTYFTADRAGHASWAPPELPVAIQAAIHLTPYKAIQDVCACSEVPPKGKKLSSHWQEQADPSLISGSDQERPTPTKCKRVVGALSDCLFN